jgi:hypothetical protein
MNVHSLSLRNWWGNRMYEQNVELYICTFFNYSQDNWANLLLMTELIINNHDSVFTEVSSLLLRYHRKVLAVIWETETHTICKEFSAKANQIVQKMKVTEWAQMIMTVAQQMQKKMINQKRQQLYDFKKENKIWLNLKNIHTDQLCKKFDVKNVKYIIVKRLAHISSVWIHCQDSQCVSLSYASSAAIDLFLSVWQICNPHHKL